MSQLKRCVDRNRPEKIIVGFPRTLAGEAGVAAEKISKQVEWLKSQIPLEWVFWDERFTTVEAERVLLAAGLSREKRRNLRDRLSAQRILQSYLDTLKRV
jgi:putative Holliday junction resolvase